MKKVVCFGDSNTFGFKPDGTGRFPEGVRWTSLLAQQLGDNYIVLEEGLNGRTTMWDDPQEGFTKEEKNGGKYLIPFLKSHLPFDVITIMLGTNDLKQRFGLTAEDIGKSMERLILLIKEICKLEGVSEPKIILMCPPPLANYIPNPDWIAVFKGGYEKSLELHQYYNEVAKQNQCGYINLADYIQTSKQDAIHFDEKDQSTIASAVKNKIMEIL